MSFVSCTPLLSTTPLSRTQSAPLLAIFEATDR